MLKLLKAIRGLSRKSIEAELLNNDLGPGSLVAKQFSEKKEGYLNIVRRSTYAQQS